MQPNLPLTQIPAQQNLFNRKVKGENEILISSRTPPGSYLALVAKYISSDQLHIRNDEVWVSKSVWQLLTTLSQPNLFKWHKLIIANPKPQHAFNLWLASLAKVNSTGQEQVFNQILHMNLDWQMLTQELLNSLIDLLVSTRQQPNLSQTFFKTIKPDNHLKDKLSLLSQLVQLCQTYQLELAKATPLILPYTQGGKGLVTTWVNLLKLVENKAEQWSLLEFVPALPKTLPLEGGIKVFTQHMLVNSAVSKTLFKTTLSDIVKLTHQEMVINASLAYLAQQDNRLPIKSYIELFNNFSQLLKDQKLDEYECNCLVKLTVLNGGKTLAPIRSLLEWTLLFKQETGSAITHKLLKPFAVGDLSKLTKACYLIYQLYTNAVSASSELDIYAINGGIDELVHSLTMAFNQINNQIDEQFSLATVLNRFSAENAELTTTLTNEELAVIRQQYLAIMDKATELADTAQLKTALSTIVQQPCQDLITILAVAYHKFKPHFGFHPHNTQILTVLALLLVKPEFKGRIAQVKTGEGKSTIVCLLALTQALSGRSVDIITSSRYLAIRDCEKYQEFFDDFGISSSHIAVENVSEKDFIGQILYGTNTDFEFALLFEQLYHHQTRVAYKDLTQLRQCDVVIVDEVDNLLIDKASESARIAMPSKYGLASYFKVVFNLVKNSGVLANLLIKPLLSQANLPEIEDEILNKMLTAAHRALFGLRENHDYIIKEITQNGITKPQVVIVDQENTGRLHEQSRYGRFVHEFLELKHDLPMGAETLTAASLSHPVFFAYYNHIFGLTGTLGSPIEREEVRYIYAIDNFDVPTHHPSLLEAMSPICLEDKATHYTALLAEAKAIKHAYRPCLILCQSIQAATNLHTYLAEHGVTNQLLTALQAEDEEFIVANAGLPGMVTVATNTAGRGTDIILHPQSKQTGGLHVVLTYYPTNLRVEKQGVGRAGRQGLAGSYRLIISRQDKMLKKLELDKYSITDQEQLFTKLVELRQAKVTRKVHARQVLADIEKVHNMFSSKFFAKLANWYNLEPVSWLNNLATQLAKAKLKDQLQPSKLIDQTCLKHIPNDTKDIVLWRNWLSQVHTSIQEQILYSWAEFYNQLEDLTHKIKAVESPYAEQYKSLLNDYTSNVKQKFNAQLGSYYNFLRNPQKSLFEELAFCLGLAS